MPTLLLFLANSEVSAVRAVDGGVQLRLSAAHARQPLPDGARSLDGFARHVVLEVQGAALVAPPSGLIGRIAEGRLQSTGLWVSALALPGTVAGPVMLDLSFANGGQLALSGQALSCRFEGDANFAESLMC